MAKLFFALPLQQLAPELIDWRDQRPWPGQPVPEANLHLTLAFLGEADQVTTARLMAAAERQHCPPLTIRLASTASVNLDAPRPLIILTCASRLTISLSAKTNPTRNELLSVLEKLPT